MEELNSNSENLAIIALKSYKERSTRIESTIKKLRKSEKNYIINAEEIRFANGEGKVKLYESVRGKDVYILCDVGNYSITYDLYGIKHHMSPDEHYQDIKRTVSAVAGKAARITVITPLLYQSRQHRRDSRESLDCAMAMQELIRLGVSEILTFDAHDPNIQNAITTSGSFDSIMPVYTILKKFSQNEKDMTKENCIIISPDNGAMERSISYASILGLDVGMFYKRRDYSCVVNGKNPIKKHEYVGPNMKGKDLIIIDDMIASGDSMMDIIQQAQKRKATGVYIIATFAFFTEGTKKFEKAYKSGMLKKVYCSNLSFVSPEAEKSEWLQVVEFSSFIGLIIHTLNSNKSISPFINSEDKITEFINNLKN